MCSIEENFSLCLFEAHYRWRLYIGLDLGTRSELGSLGYGFKRSQVNWCR